MNTGYISGTITSMDRSFPVVTTQWSLRDILGTLKVRWNIGRMKYRVEPGIYATGNPGRTSEIFVTGNYKLSFDHLRRALDGMNAWIMVIDTKGINVWCAAGKKKFSTDEVVRKIELNDLKSLVDHHKIILPQLSATGVSAHEVKERTGFNVIYGPVKAEDIREFVGNHMRATEEMRTVRFPLTERLKLIPVDVSYGGYYMLIVPFVFLMLSGLNSGGYSLSLALNEGWRPVVSLLAGYLAGCAITPALLPWIPFRMFSLKGMITGLVIAAIFALTGVFGQRMLVISSLTLIIAGLSAFMAMNFTGSSTFTSLSGVKKEMKLMLPVQIILVSLGLCGWIVSLFVNF